MKKVILVYDDCAKPNPAIRSITGGKSFGNTIFKRLKLSDQILKSISDIANIENFIILSGRRENLTQLPADDAFLVLYSSFIISDMNEFRILAEKASYAHDNYKVMVEDKIACAIYNNRDAFLEGNAENEKSFMDIECSAFTDISDVNNFRQFITSGFEARFFNAVSGDDYTVVKRSKNIDKLEREYKFYSLLPDSMKQWFVMPYDYKVEGDTASYTMERFHMADLAIRYVHGAISYEEFDAILDKLFYFISKRVQKDVNSSEYEEMAQNLYINKVDDRIAQLKKCEGFEKIERMISDNTDFSGIDEIVASYKEVYSSIRNGRNFKNVLVVAHGDLCFSNILYSHETSLVKLIDPKGALCENDLYMDPYYDVAKLSHSICGYYDYFNSDLFEITFDENLKAHVTIDFDNSNYVKIFREKLEKYSFDFRLIRLYESSLFLSMLPLHIDRPKKVFAFLLNAIAIIDSIKGK